MISIVILGAGNVAQNLYKALRHNKTVTVKQWYNRDISALEPYKNEVEPTDDLSQLNLADVYIIAISDDGISDISSAIPFEGRFVVHTSGSVNIHDLDKKNERGVFYPLQTFSKDREIDFKNVPFCIEVLDRKNLKILSDLATAMGSTSEKVNSEQRQILHLSAVFVNNFVNQLYRIGHEISDYEGVNFNILKPLIIETAMKIKDMSPYQAQTGPALRNDKKTIEKHLRMLDKKEHKEIYNIMTNSIKKTHGR